MKVSPDIQSISNSILAHAEEYDDRLGASLRALAVEVLTSGSASPTVNKLFGQEGGLYQANPSREEDIALLFAEMRLPRNYLNSRKDQ